MTEQTGELAQGVFTLSLDFELIWGTADHGGPERFRRACEIEREVVIERLLALLAEFDVSATWCIVGHLFLDSCAPADGAKHPEIVAPAHAWATDWFVHDPCGSEQSDPIFYGASLLEQIRACPVPQEVGCHSFSHVIFGDEGCSRETAASEIRECVRLAHDRDIQLRSFAFPRNSVAHLDVLHEYGFTSYRGPEHVWWERPRVPRVLKRLGHLTDVLTARRPPVVAPYETLDGLWDVPGSMLLFPMHGFRRYIPAARRVKRAVKGLEQAARERKIFHLWFHPTNLADETDRMFGALRSIFERVADLRQQQQLVVRTMGSVIEPPSSSQPSLYGSPVGGVG